MPQNNQSEMDRARSQWGYGIPNAHGTAKPKTHLEVIQEKYDEQTAGGTVVDIDAQTRRPMTREEINRLKNRYRPTTVQHGPYQRPEDMTDRQIAEERSRLHYNHPRQAELDRTMMRRVMRRFDPREIRGGDTGWCRGPVGMGSGPDSQPRR